MSRVVPRILAAAATGAVVARIANIATNQLPMNGHDADNVKECGRPRISGGSVNWCLPRHGIMTPAPPLAVT